MGSSGKKKTTMAKLARENKLRERRLNKQARKEARKQAASDEPEITGAPGEQATAPTASSCDAGQPAPASERVHAEPSAMDDKEAALNRLRDASDEQLAVFEARFQAGALTEGASESEMRAAQRDHPGHAGDSPAT